MKKPQTLALTLALCLAAAGVRSMAQSTGDRSSQDSSRAQSTAQQPQTPENQAGQPSQTDREKNPEGRQVEQQIQSAFQADPQSAYSRVTVQMRDNDIVLSGTVLSDQAKQDAESIAARYAGGRKVKNEIKVNKTNPTTAPGPGSLISL